MGIFIGVVMGFIIGGMFGFLVCAILVATVEQEDGK